MVPFGKLIVQMGMEACLIFANMVGVILVSMIFGVSKKTILKGIIMVLGFGMIEGLVLEEMLMSMEEIPK